MRTMAWERGGKDVVDDAVDRVEDDGVVLIGGYLSCEVASSSHLRCMLRVQMATISF